MLKPIAGIGDPTLRRLLRWWNEKRGVRPMPSRVDLDPTELRDILPDLLLLTVEPLDEGYCCTCRLAGTRVEAWLGTSLRGKRADEIAFGSAATSVLEQYELTVRRAEPTLCEERYVITRRRRVRYQRILVPLSGTDSGVGHLLGAVVFEEQPAA